MKGGLRRRGTIRIGVKEFNCIGVSPPHDHPHIYLDVGNDDRILCPYCATLFRIDPRLGPGEADPPDCLFIDELVDEASPNLVSDRKRVE